MARKFNFGIGKLALTDKNGVALQIGTVQEVSFDFSQDIKEIHGENKDTVAVAGGKRKITGKIKLADYDARVLNALFFNGSVTTGTERMSTETFTAAATVTPANASDFVTDLGVTVGGVLMKKVASTPAIGEYSVNTSTGVYTFNASQTGQLIVSYIYSSTAGEKYTVDTELMGDLNTFELHLFQSYNGQNVCRHYKKVFITKYSEALKNDEFTMPEFDVQFAVDENNELFAWSVY